MRKTSGKPARQRRRRPRRLAPTGLFAAACLLSAHGRRSVAVLGAGGYMQERITVGMDNKTKAQVIGGLAEGDCVVVGAMPPDTSERGQRGPVTD